MKPKILYGVQGTGNGHISRARVMAEHFAARNVEVDYLFSGRDQSKYFDMEIFGDCQYRRGLTFKTTGGKVQYLETFLQNRKLQFIRDVTDLSVREYDWVITDYEPIVAWAAYLSGVPVIGVGHQYAFDHNIPTAGDSLIAKFLLKYFAPANLRVGLHWDNFGSAILPPIIESRLRRDTNNDRKDILVYLPFEDQTNVTCLLNRLRNHRFIQYAPGMTSGRMGNVFRKSTCLEGFRNDLCGVSGVICNTGFELISECLHLGLPVLTKPLHGQMEQLSNAAALRDLKLARTMDELSEEEIYHWLLSRSPSTPQQYPDVAACIVDHLLDTKDFLATDLRHMSDKLWGTGHRVVPPQLRLA